MAKIRFSKKEFEKYHKIDSKLLERISMFGTPVDEFEDELEIEIFPNRPDLISLNGFMRGFNAFLEKEKGMRKYKLNSPEKNFKVQIDKSVEKVRPFTACAIVKGLKFDDSKIKELMDLQEKLHVTLGRNRKKVAIGVYPLEKMALPIKYEARSPDKIRFVPLESETEMDGMQIIQQHPKGKEYAHLLKGKSVFPIFVDGNKKILSMPPIINSNETGKVDEKTKEVFVECSGNDFETLKKALNIVVTTLSDLGGKIFQMELDYSGKEEITPNFEPEKIKISLENVNKLLGLELKEKDLEKLLPKMGYDYAKGIVSIPPWRTDILHEVDITEDIAIAYGYDDLIPEIPSVSTIGEESKESVVKSKISEILSGLGLIEISSLHLIKHEELRNMKQKESEAVQLMDSKTDYKVLRNSLMIPALRTLFENKNNEYPQKIFEIGNIFVPGRSIMEESRLLIACIPSNFTELKQMLDYLMKMLDIEYEIKDSPVISMIDGRTAQVIVNKKEIGFIGEVNPEILDNWNLKQPLAVIEISLDEIFEKFK
ncbi:MAG: phenylalanine--tRNA ligase subunit beta [Nanoarchaeota archaeon]|nr:phenylalanine--tRNA ligase subunit beta [Nanoarchaeota archaeon]